jgi:hypothetical protein
VQNHKHNNNLMAEEALVQRVGISKSLKFWTLAAAMSFEALPSIAQISLQ